MDDKRVITLRKSDQEIKRFARDVLTHPVTLFVVFFTGIYVVFIGTSIYSNYGIPQQLVINLAWAGIYYLYLFAVAPSATIWLIDNRIPFFPGYWALLFVPCLAENIVGALLLGLDSRPPYILFNTFKNVLFMAPGLAVLLALKYKKYEEGVFLVPPVQFVWFRWEDRKIIGDYNSPRAPIHIEALNSYCNIYRKGEKPELERISLAAAIEKYCFKIEGARVHRSHWIALDQVKGVKYVNGNPQIELISGSSIPTNRKMYKEIKYYCEVKYASIPFPPRSRVEHAEHRPVSQS